MTILSRVQVALGALCGGTAVVVDESVVWSGQPSAAWPAVRVRAWYHDHAVAVIVGDLLWVAACAALFVGLWWVTASLPMVARRLGRVAAAAAAGGLAVSAVVAAGVAVRSEQLSAASAHAWWSFEGSAYAAGAVLLAIAVLVPAAVRARAGHAGVALAWLACAVALIVPDLRDDGLVLTLLGIALAVARGGPSVSGDLPNGAETLRATVGTRTR